MGGLVTVEVDGRKKLVSPEEADKLNAERQELLSLNAVFSTSSPHESSGYAAKKRRGRRTL
jgi:hypothetical protein